MFETQEAESEVYNGLYEATVLLESGEAPFTERVSQAIHRLGLIAEFRPGGFARSGGKSRGNDVID